MSKQSREMSLRLFACDCAVRAFDRWIKSGREPDPRCLDLIEKVRAVAEGKSPIGELAAAREVADVVTKEMVKAESRLVDAATEQGRDMGDVIREQMSWYGAMNCMHAACMDDYELAAEYAAREGRREARRVNDEKQEIEWQEKRLVKLQIIPRARL